MSKSIFNYQIIMLLASLIALTGCSDKKQIFTETSCSVDAVNGSGELIVATKRNSVLVVAGWAFDKLSKQTPESISINLVSSTGMVSKLAEGIKVTVARPDVSAVYNAPSITNAGFGISVQLKSQTPGTYELQILQHFSDRILVCKSNKSIKIE